MSDPRSPSGPYEERPAPEGVGSVSVSGPPLSTLLVGALVVVALGLSAAMVGINDPTEHEGASVLVGVFAIPCLAIALAIIVLAHALVGKLRITPSVWVWTLVVLPVGAALLTVPVMLAEREYFEAETTGSLIGALALMVMLAYLGVLCGPLVWFFLLWPLDMLLTTLIALIRGERGIAWRLVVPVIWLSVTALIPLLTFAADFATSGRRATVALVAAFLGLPGDYTIDRPAFLWAARIVVVAIVVVVVVAVRRGRQRRDAQPATPDPTRDRAGL